MCTRVLVLASAFAAFDKETENTTQQDPTFWKSFQSIKQIVTPAKQEKHMYTGEKPSE